MGPGTWYGAAADFLMMSLAMMVPTILREAGRALRPLVRQSDAGAARHGADGTRGDRRGGRARTRYGL